MCNLDGFWLSAGTMLSKRDDICAVLRIPRKNPPKHAAFLRRSKSLCPHVTAGPDQVARVGGVIEHAGPPTRGGDPKRGPLSHPSFDIGNDLGGENFRHGITVLDGAVRGEGGFTSTITFMRPPTRPRAEIAYSLRRSHR